MIATTALVDVRLDWAVAFAIATEERQLSALRVITSGSQPFIRLLHDGGNPRGSGRNTNFSTDWSAGGPIIEREGILLRPLRRPGHALDGQWLAMYDGTNTGSLVQWVSRADFPRHYLAGPAPLIAAMRCYVASKLGDEVDVPKDLL